MPLDKMENVSRASFHLNELKKRIPQQFYSGDKFRKTK